MNTAIIVSSHQPQSNSLKVGRHIHNRLNPLGFKDAGMLVLEELGLEIWHPDHSDDDKRDKIDRVLSPADALVVITPEYHGMASPALKNLFLNIKRSQVGHKPALLVSVSSGRGGSYPIAEMRMSSYKNCRLVYIPEHVIVRDADHVLNPPDEQKEDDSLLRERIDWSLQVLKLYSDGLQNVRNSELPFNKEFGNGM